VFASIAGCNHDLFKKVFLPVGINRRTGAEVNLVPARFARFAEESNRLGDEPAYRGYQPALQDAGARVGDGDFDSRLVSERRIRMKIAKINRSWLNFKKGFVIRVFWVHGQSVVPLMN